jgi:hypothetical protein
MAESVVTSLLDVEGEDSSSSAPLTVSSTGAAQILLRSEQRRFLEPFVGRERSASQAARELELPVESMAYRVRALTAKGLLSRTGTVPRKGRAITLYRAPSEIRAPLDLLPYEDLRGFFALVDSGLREVFLASLARSAERAGLGDWLVRLYRADDGTIRLDLAPAGGVWDPALLLSPSAPAVVFNWVPLAIDRRQAKELQRELLALVARHHVPGAAPTHLMGLFLTPTGRR